MVASVSALTSSAQASSYYEADDYYAQGGLSPSLWQGQGAQALGLSGEVDRDRFRALLDGRIGDQQLGTYRGGALEHRPGWDVTLSAPKSVSIMAEVAGDRRLIEAHGQAVKTAMAHVERHMAATRVRDGGTVARAATDNLIIASFQHGTSRAQDPQLHTHNVIMNATQGGRGALAPIASPLASAKAVANAAAQAECAGHSWNSDQRSATQQLLTSRNRITAVQGYAGTAKTTTVLATFAREAQARGVSVTALAPTASAAMTLGEALGTNGDTVARHLLSPELGDPGRPAAWIVDEASLLSARDTARLLELAAKHDVRILLVGDVKQLGSVEAGAAFAQLQGAGMETARLTEIVRQTNGATREAVLASVEGDARKAMAALDRGGGQVIEGADRMERFAAIARRYAALDKAGRARTIIIEPSREGRDALTADIRAALARSEILTGSAVAVESLANKGLTRADARDPLSYDKGDVVRFTRDYADKGVARGEAYRVESIDPARAAIALRAQDGREVDWRLRQWGAGHAQVFLAQPIEIRAGDAIRFTRNDRETGRVNGARAHVLAVDREARTATVRTDRGKTGTLHLDSARDRHIAHDYVDTAFAAQGRTADHVIIHADSRATNLVDQKSFYVGISRAKLSATIYTNDRDRLVAAINERAGQVQTALPQARVPALMAGIMKSAGLG